jgi:exonuclease SbcC
LEQSRSALEHLNQQRDSKAQELESCHYQAQLYAELMQAFGKKGLQTLLIENLLPQLETETNAILTRLTSHQLHVQFITQRSSRRSAQDKLIDTLDIRIADIRGTRSYETFSGGEAFRVNFAIRLALARVLAQRSGSPLQLLIVDEGFGTQDHEGCDRLIAAINAIAQDFACILIITHMPQFKEAFQTRLEVEKTTTGSQIRLVL